MIPELVIGLVAGCLAGLFGIGGGMLLIPTFRFFGLGAHEAIATALPVTIPTSLFGAIVMRKRVKLKTAVAAGAVGSMFSAVGAYSTTFVGDSFLMFGVASIFLLFALLTLRHRHDEDSEDNEKIRRTFFIGTVGGFISGFFGIGGGAILVPLLMKFRKTEIDRAVPTSLAIISIYSIVGSVAHFSLGNIVVETLVPVIAGSLVGMFIVSRIKIHPELRKNAFIVFMVLMAAVIIVREII